MLFLYDVSPIIAAICLTLLTVSHYVSVTLVHAWVTHYKQKQRPYTVGWCVGGSGEGSLCGRGKGFIIRHSDKVVIMTN